jgi:hypothetical protein
MEEGEPMNENLKDLNEKDQETMDGSPSTVRDAAIRRCLRPMCGI